MIHHDQVDVVVSTYAIVGGRRKSFRCEYEGMSTSMQLYNCYRTFIWPLFLNSFNLMRNKTLAFTRFWKWGCYQHCSSYTSPSFVYTTGVGEQFTITEHLPILACFLSSRRQNTMINTHTILHCWDWSMNPMARCHRRLTLHLWFDWRRQKDYKHLILTDYTAKRPPHYCNTHTHTYIDTNWNNIHLAPFPNKLTWDLLPLILDDVLVLDSKHGQSLHVSN